MTNKELLKIIDMAIARRVNVKSLRRILVAMERTKGISEEEVNDILMLEQSGVINDEAILTILEKVIIKGCHNWKEVVFLQNTPYIKEFLKDKDFKKNIWEMIIKIIHEFPLYREDVEKLYCAKLSEQIDASSNQELEFFQKVFYESMYSSFLFNKWYLAYLLDPTKPRRLRNEVLKLMGMVTLEEDLNTGELEALALKTIKCCELYGLDFAIIYEGFAKQVPSYPVPHIVCEEERNIYRQLYFFEINKLNVQNFLNSYYYRLATSEEIEPEKRLEFVTNLQELKLILKDSVVKNLWEAYLEWGLRGLLTMKRAFLNKGIRTNRLCRDFLEQETSLEVVEMARKTFSINRLRKDTESLGILIDLPSVEEKKEFLNYLKNKYPYETPEQIRRRVTAVEEVGNAYNVFLDNKMGLKKLRASLEETKDLHIELRMVRRLDDRDGI